MRLTCPRPASPRLAGILQAVEWGGFFALGVSAAGVEEIEASIEFGGNISLNLGVASGGVYVMAGVYFKMSTT